MAIVLKALGDQKSEAEICCKNHVTYWEPDGAIEASLTKLGPFYDKNYLFACRFTWIDSPEKNVSVEENDGKYSPRFKYHALIVIYMRYHDDKILEHEKHHAAGYEWLYERNVEKLREAELRVFESKEEAFKFGIEYFEKTVYWRPAKWKIHDPNWPLGLPVNIIGWFTHSYMWEKWAKNKNWN